MEKVSTSGRTEKSTTVSGSGASRTATESGRERMVNHILASGSTLRHKATACMSSPMVINMKESGSNAFVKETALISSQMVTVMSASMSQVNQRALVSTNGKTVAATLDNSRTD